jgi:hypothetical protein
VGDFSFSSVHAFFSDRWPISSSDKLECIGGPSAEMVGGPGAETMGGPSSEMLSGPSALSELEVNDPGQLG